MGSLYHEPLWVFYRGGKPLDASVNWRQTDGVGPPGSGTHAIAMQLLAVNGLSEPAESNEVAKTVLVEDNAMASATALQKGELDAAFFVAAFEADYIKILLNDDRVQLLSFGQHEAYQRKFRYLAQVTVPAGLVNLGQNRPDRDIALLAPTALLVARKDLHPALVPLFLTAARASTVKAMSFPTPASFLPQRTPISRSARTPGTFTNSARPCCSAVAFLVGVAGRSPEDHADSAAHVARAADPGCPTPWRWRTRRKIYVWYAALRDIDQKLATGLSGAELDLDIARLRDIEHQVTYVKVPLSYMDEFYHLRLHLKMVQDNLQNLRAQQGTEEEDVKK